MPAPIKPSSRARHLASACLAAGLLSLLLAASAWAAAGALVQKPGTPGCTSDNGTAGACIDGSALNGARGVTVSPDGVNVYVTSSISAAVSVFDREPFSGVLTQLAGTAGCVSDGGSGGCANGTGLDGASSVAISPDGANAYVSSLGGRVTIFDRNTSTGALTQKAGEAGCISDIGNPGVCADGTALSAANSVTVSPDGANVYLAASTGNAVAIFDRNSSTGALTQKAGTAGCISEDGTAGSCVNGKALDGAASVVISADGATAYVASITSDAVAVFDRNTSTGALTQKAATAGCISETGSAGACADGKALDGAISVTAAADGASVYVASQQSGAVSVFDRNSGTGALTQKAGTAGCISDGGTAGACVDGTALQFATSVAVSPDGTSAYVASQNSSAIAVFSRDPDTGGLTQKPGTDACVSDTGSSGACADGTALGTATAVTVAPNSVSAYAASFTGDAVAIFDRTPPPDTTIDTGPNGLTADATPSFSFSSTTPGSSFECRIDAAPFDFCSGPGATHTPDALADGPHTFEVRAVDDGDNPDPTAASQSFSVDASAPQTSIVSGPSGLTADATPSFTFSSSDGDPTFECRIDEDAFGPCSGPGTAHSPSALSDGSHVFAVRSADPLSNTDPTPATRAFSVDTRDPVTEITRPPNPKVGTKKKTARVAVSFRSEDGAAFECALDKASLAPCSSPFSVKAKSKRGKGKKHTITVHATDPAGNVGPEASVSFKLIRVRK